MFYCNENKSVNITTNVFNSTTIIMKQNRKNEK